MDRNEFLEQFQILMGAIDAMEGRITERIPSKIDRLEERLIGRIAVMEADVGALKEDVSTIVADVNVIRKDVSVLKADVSELKAEILDFKYDVKQLKADVVKLEENARKVETKIEREVSQKIDALSDGDAVASEKQWALERRVEKLEPA